jgi:hypothetical protein
MTERTFCLSTLRLQAGMRVARTLHRPDGAVLLPEGSELTDAHLEQLPQRGIDVVYVSQLDPRSPDEIAHDLALADARVSHIFRPQNAAEIAESAEIAPSDDARAALESAVRAYRQAGWPG